LILHFIVSNVNGEKLGLKIIIRKRKEGAGERHDVKIRKQFNFMLFFNNSWNDEITTRPVMARKNNPLAY